VLEGTDNRLLTCFLELYMIKFYVAVSLKKKHGNRNIPPGEKYLEMSLITPA